MKREKLYLILTKLICICFTAFISSLLYAPASVRAEEESIYVLAYSEQEGMGTVTSYCNNTAFKDSVSARSGDVVTVYAQYFPKCTFEGWYVNGVAKSTQQSYSFTVSQDSPMYIITAKFRQNGDQFHGRTEMDISQTNWSNRTCRFADGSGAGDIAVTTAMAVQGEACMAAFESVLEDYRLARTYNITFTKYYNKNIEVLDEPADFVFQIPSELQLPGRTFRMIHVYEGQPTVLPDMDSSDSTVTFRNDKAGAYALVYYDAPAAIPDEDEEIDPYMTVTPGIECLPFLNPVFQN